MKIEYKTSKESFVPDKLSLKSRKNAQISLSITEEEIVFLGIFAAISVLETTLEFYL